MYDKIVSSDLQFISKHECTSWIYNFKPWTPALQPLIGKNTEAFHTTNVHYRTYSLCFQVFSVRHIKYLHWGRRRRCLSKLACKRRRLSGLSLNYRLILWPPPQCPLNEWRAANKAGCFWFKLHTYTTYLCSYKKKCKDDGLVRGMQLLEKCKAEFSTNNLEFF